MNGVSRTKSSGALRSLECPVSFLLAVGLCVAGCRSPPPSSAALVSQAKSGLIAREAKLTSLHLTVKTTEDEQADGLHEVFFRAPYRLRARVSAPTPLQLSFDGESLYLLQGSPPQLSVKKVGTGEATAASLQQQFEALIPDGYASPLLPGKGVTGALTRIDGADAVTLTVITADGATPVTLRWDFTWPALELIARRSKVGAVESMVKVEQRHCDETLKLCVPSELSRWQGGKRIGTLSVTSIELNPALPQDDFVLHAPTG